MHGAVHADIGTCLMQGMNEPLGFSKRVGMDEGVFPFLTQAIDPGKHIRENKFLRFPAK